MRLNGFNTMRLKFRGLPKNAYSLLVIDKHSDNLRSISDTVQTRSAT